MKNKAGLSRKVRWAHGRALAGLAVLASLSPLLPACNGKNKKQSDEATTSVASSAASGAVPERAPRPAASAPVLPPQMWQVPSGPRFAILPGQGIGPIRIGATVATIERLMEAPCEFKTEDACRYVARAVEFFLKDGVTTEIRIHRKDRVTTPKPQAFGIFNGKFVEGAQFFMLPAAVHELIGPAKRIEAVDPKEAGDWNTVEVHHYDGMRLEFDRMDNGNLVLGGVIIRK